MNYQDWVATVPKELTTDALWTVEVYRLAAFATYAAWQDVVQLERRWATRRLSGQLADAVGSIGANISEGFSKQSGTDRARFYEYALASAREARHWYLSAVHVVGADRLRTQLELIGSIIRLLLVALPQERRRHLGRTRERHR